MGTLYVILGPTGVGKSELAMSAAERLGTGIISADSRQIYRELPIGTAAPTAEMQARVPHSFVGSLSVTEAYSAGQYELDAIPIIEQSIARTGSAIVVGGSMMYIDAICRGIDPLPDADPAIRAELNRRADTEGLDPIRALLLKLDPTTYARIDKTNRQRMIHAVEITLTAGRPYSSLITGQAKPRPFQIRRIGLTRPREELYRRIDRRVGLMIDQGLEAEARAVEQYRGLNPLNTVGYKELFGYFDGRYDRDEAIRLIRRNTRHYARKQLTWFRRDPAIEWHEL